MIPGTRALGQDGYASTRSLVFTGCLLLFVIATRWWLAPRYLYYFDSANFALALEQFNPALHQPQPPGYPLFVGLSRLIHLWVMRPEQVFLIAGLAGACAAVLLIRVLATDLFGRAAGYLAAAVLASSPVFWFGGITNQVRVFLALASVGVTLLAWRALTRQESPGWFYGMFAALGVAGGFRPVAACLLFPLLMWVWFRSGRGAGRLVKALGCFAVTAMPWLVVTVWASGGPAKVAALLWEYARVQFSGTSAVFGASPHSAYKMAVSALAWHLLGPLVWIWAIPLAIRRPRSQRWREKALFLAAAFSPPFLFSALIHIGDPDQALAGVAILAVVGGAVMAAVHDRVGRKHLWALCVAVIAGHALIFFFPPGKLARAASYRAVAAVDRMNREALTAVESLRKDGPITIVHYGSLVASRHLAYYFPDDYVVVLPGSPARPAAGETALVYYRHGGLAVPPGATGLIHPGSRRVVCLLPWNAQPSDLPGAKVKGAVYYFDNPPEAGLAIGPYRLIRAVQ